MINEKLKPPLSSAKAVAEFYKKKAIEDKEKEETRRLASEQVALQKESNELATEIRDANLRAEQERALQESGSIDLVDIKPNFFGIGANLNEVWRRIKKWLSK